MNEAPDSGKADPEHIRPDEPENLREWSARFGISVAELTRIITEVGRDPDEVRAYLNTRPDVRFRLEAVPTSVVIGRLVDDRRGFVGQRLVEQPVARQQNAAGTRVVRAQQTFPAVGDGYSERLRDLDGDGLAVPRLQLAGDLFDQGVAALPSPLDSISIERWLLLAG